MIICTTAKAVGHHADGAEEVVCMVCVVIWVSFAAQTNSSGYVASWSLTTLGRKRRKSVPLNDRSIRIAGVTANSFLFIGSFEVILVIREKSEPARPHLTRRLYGEFQCD